jgi:hypothetical protein
VCFHPNQWNNAKRIGRVHLYLRNNFCNWCQV